MAKKLDMIDETGDALRTFTDYTEQKELQLMQLLLDSGNAWVGMAVRDLDLPPDTMLVIIQRGENSVIPRGDTILMAGDTVVLTAGYYGKLRLTVPLCEVRITAEHPWNGKTLAELSLPKEELVVLIRRGTESIIPLGDTEICDGNILVKYEN